MTVNNFDITIIRVSGYGERGTAHPRITNNETGMKVHYKLQSDKRWRGPGEVIGQACKQVYIKHGGVYYRVNPCNVRPAKHYTQSETPVEIAPNNDNGQSSDDESSIGSDESCQPENGAVDSDGDISERYDKNPTKFGGSLPSIGSSVRYQY